MKRCPKCSLLSPDETIMCDCGYPFDRAAAVRARLTGFEPLSERERQKAEPIPWRVSWAGAFFGSLPFWLIVSYRDIFDLSTDGAKVGCWVGAIAGILIARWIYRRRNQTA